MDWGHDVWFNIVEFLDENNITKIALASKQTKKQFSKGKYWKHIVNDIKNPNSYFMKKFWKEYTRCKHCNIIVNKTKWYEDPYCFDCYIDAYICVMS